MAKYKLTIEYDGASYSGWQTQKNAKSIQGTLITATRDLLGHEVDVQGAGRTDAGVHALGQVAHLETGKVLPPKKLMEGLNDRLPSNINVLRVEKVHARFHARHHATARTYVYLVSKRRTAFAKRYVWWVRDPLDVEKMQTACRLFEGLHDFVSFADKRFDKDASTRVQIDRVGIVPLNGLIVFTVTGSHFLWKMVRRMVGILVEVGRGKLKAGDVAGMLKTFSETPAQCTAPPSGLFLMQVRYEGDSEEPLRVPFLITPLVNATDLSGAFSRD
ncbi:MAG: tRNA pseudouridine(38-40) synthase TruA [Pseudomonadota bacterium]